MGKSYNNVIKLTELFSGSHPLLEKSFHPMAVRFFILQTQYRSTLDFSNEALMAAEKGLKRLWDAYEILQKTDPALFPETGADTDLETKCIQLIDAFAEFMDDDLNTAKVLANMFELVPVINGLKDKHIATEVLSASLIRKMQDQMKLYLETILGLKTVSSGENDRFKSVMQLIMDLRKEAKSKKDFVTSDTIRQRLTDLGIQLKDEKDGGMSYSC
jgi:cysteinyl-tRNA synthetase